MVSRTARCACGQLSIRVTGAPRGVGVCHCLDCQRRTGSVFATLAAFTAPGEVSGESRVYVRTGDAGARFAFHFCPGCGTSLFHKEEGNDETISVAVGGFGDPDFPAPEVSVYECRRHAWVALPPDVVGYGRDPV